MAPTPTKNKQTSPAYVKNLAISLKNKNVSETTIGKIKARIMMFEKQEKRLINQGNKATKFQRREHDYSIPGTSSSNLIPTPSPTSSGTYETFNKFNLLSEDGYDNTPQQAMETEGETESNPDEATRKKEYIPPLMLYNVQNWNAIAKDLKQFSTEKFTAKSTFDFLKLQMQNADDYRATTKYLDDKKIKYHTLQYEQK